MEDLAVAEPNSIYRRVEFYAFCVTSFSAKSVLLIGLPYREWPVNTAYTCSLLLFFYLFFRFRQGLRAPVMVVLSLAAAVAVDVLGNKLGLYGHPFGPLRDYDEFAHFTGSGFSAIAALWLLRAGTQRMGFRLSNPVLGFLSTAVAFTYCGWYEILELWDEYFWSHFERIHTWDDTPNDLFYDFLGVIVFVAGISLFFAARERMAKQSGKSDTLPNRAFAVKVQAGTLWDPRNLVPLRLRDLFKALPGPLLTFFVVAVGFGTCCWFEIFRMFDQLWFGRIHLVGNRDSPIYLQWELGGCVVLGVLLVTVFKLVSSRKGSTG